MKAGRPGGEANPPSLEGRDARRSICEAAEPTLPARTKTDSGGRVEHTEAIGGTVVKELGIIAP